MSDIDRHKRNVKKMIEGGATEQEIDSYLSSEGVTAEMLRGATANAVSGQADTRSHFSKNDSFDWQRKMNAQYDRINDNFGQDFAESGIGGKIKAGVGMLGVGIGQGIMNPIDTAKDVAVSIKNITPNLNRFSRANRRAISSIVQGDTDTAKQQAKESLGSGFNAGLGILEGYTLGRSKAVTGALDKAKTLGRTANLAADAVPTDKNALRVIYQAAKTKGMSRLDVQKKMQEAAKAGDMTPVWKLLGLDNTAMAVTHKGEALGEKLVAGAQDRIAGQSARVQKSFSDAIGGKDFVTVRDDISARFKQQSGPLYKEAYATPLRETPELRRLLERPKMKEFIDGARKKLKDVAGIDNPSMTEVLHEAHRDIRNAVKNSYANGMDGGMLEKELRKPLHKALGDANPAYGKARKIYAGAAADREALEIGEKIFNNGGFYKFESAVKGMSESEIQSVRAGVFAAIEKQLDNPETFNSIRAQLRKPSFKRKLLTIMPKGKVNAFVKSLDDEFEAFIRDAKLDPARNSKTAPVQEAISVLDEQMKPAGRKAADALGDAAQNPILTAGAAYKAAVKTGDKGLQKILSRNDDVTLKALDDLLSASSKDALEMFGKLPPNRQKKVLNLMQRIEKSKSADLLQRAGAVAVMQSAMVSL